MRRPIGHGVPRPRAPRTAVGAGVLAGVLLVTLALRVAHVLALRDTP